MKKHLRFVLVLVLAFVMAIPALAYSETFEGSGIGYVDVVVEYIEPTDNRAEIEAGAEGTRVYSVTLEWATSGKIIYNAGKTVYSWNDSSLTYDSETMNEGWSVDGAKITIGVINRSNRPVDVTCEDPAPIQGIGLTGKYDRSTMTVASAAPDDFHGVGTAQREETVYTIDGVTGKITGETTNIASITVTVKGK